MLRFFLFVASAIIFYVIIKILMNDLFSLRKRAEREHEPEELVQDPQCQTYIPKRLAIRKRLAGKDHYFCDQNCLRNYSQAKHQEGSRS